MRARRIFEEQTKSAVRKIKKIKCKKQCRDPGSNRGPLDLQSNALPTELSRPDENELAFPFSAGGDEVLSLGKKKSCVGRESNPDQLLGRQLC